MQFIKTESESIIQPLRHKLYQEFVGPLDGMWEALYIAQSETYLIKTESNTIGYCCIDAENSLTQIYLEVPFKYLMNATIGDLITSKHIRSAKLSSIEVVSFNACLLHSKSIESDTINYQYTNNPSQNNTKETIALRTAEPKDVASIQSFYKNEIGFDDQFGYVKNLVHRKELYLAESSNSIIATGECRLSETQPKYADIGMAVKQAERKKGIGTKMLLALAKTAQEKNRFPICSTTIDNIASQKAIEKAGLYRTHIIFNINFW